jgi:hypothetical protein
MVTGRTAFSVLVRTPQGPPGRSGRGWEDIELNPKDKGFDDLHWIHLAQDRDQWKVLLNTVKNL